MVADRPTVYHTVMDVGLDIDRLRNFCSKAENVVHEHDWNANGDFTLMHRDLWFRLQGLSTPLGTAMAGVDMQTIRRAEQLMGQPRSIYPHKIWHIRHPGSPLASSFDTVTVSPDWGFPNEKFEEIIY
jgi:hypothetical protein